jgi:DNA topoisomerase-1
MKTLILVESPTKAKTLSRFLGAKYEIQASMGHIRDLPKGAIGVDIENNFEPKYVIPKDKRKTVENLKDDAKDVDHIILATDPDREGEAISFHLKTVLSEENKKAKFDRIVFHEITPKAINEALEHPHDIDMNLVAAQTGRRVLDRVVGYKLSPVLWMKIKKGLSAGRVQSIALRLIVEREREIEKFKGEEFYRLFATLAKTEKNPILFELVKINDEAIEKTNTLKLYDGEYKFAKTSLSQTDATSIENDLHGKDFTVLDVNQRESKRAPYPPFTTSLLQIEASRRFGYPSKRTMSLAQRLYEEGFITYHRTDSYNLSTDFISAARDYIEKNFGKKYIPDSPRTYQTKSKVAQEAHEAIRPTNLFEDESTVEAKLGKDFAKLYNLIYKRALATQMADALFLSTRIDVLAKGNKDYLFQANGRVMKFDGFLKIWFYEDPEQLIPDLTVGDKLNLLEIKITNHNTTPPPRYNEGSLISSLEKHGIGRPSTYAPIISTISERYYVEKDENRFKPNEIGTIFNDFLVKNFSEIYEIQ